MVHSCHCGAAGKDSATHKRRLTHHTSSVSSSPLASPRSSERLNPNPSPPERRTLSRHAESPISSQDLSERAFQRPQNLEAFWSYVELLYATPIFPFLSPFPLDHHGLLLTVNNLVMFLCYSHLHLCTFFCILRNLLYYASFGLFVLVRCKDKIPATLSPHSTNWHNRDGVSSNFFH